MGHNGGKVDGEASLTGIQPLYSGRVAKPWDPGLNTIIVMGGASQVVVLELHVVYPAIHKLLHEQVMIKSGDDSKLLTSGIICCRLSQSVNQSLVLLQM